MLLALVVVVIVAGWLVLRLPPFGGRFEGAWIAGMRSSPQWHGGRFENPPPDRGGRRASPPVERRPRERQPELQRFRRNRERWEMV
jgi:hypothetical protein